MSNEILTEMVPSLANTRTMSLRHTSGLIARLGVSIHTVYGLDPIWCGYKTVRKLNLATFGAVFCERGDHCASKQQYSTYASL